jgi:hypothetical protein
MKAFDDTRGVALGKPGFKLLSRLTHARLIIRNLKNKKLLTRLGSFSLTSTTIPVG